MVLADSILEVIDSVDQLGMANFFEKQQKIYSHIIKLFIVILKEEKRSSMDKFGGVL